MVKAKSNAGTQVQNLVQNPGKIWCKTDAPKVQNTVQNPGKTWVIAFPPYPYSGFTTPCGLATKKQKNIPSPSEGQHALEARCPSPRYGLGARTSLQAAPSTAAPASANPLLPHIYCTIEIARPCLLPGWATARRQTSAYQSQRRVPLPALGSRPRQLHLAMRPQDRTGSSLAFLAPSIQRPAAGSRVAINSRSHWS